jgi:hypothetical protein
VVLMEFEEFSFPETRLICFDNLVVQVRICNNSVKDCELYNSTPKARQNVKKIIYYALECLANSPQNPLSVQSVQDEKEKIGAYISVKRWSLSEKYKFFHQGIPLDCCKYKLSFFFFFNDSEKKEA